MSSAAEVTADMMREVFETNVFGVVRVTHAFLPLLQRSAAPVIVNVSSGLGSMARMTTPGSPSSAYPGVAYPASKAAVNMITLRYAKAFPGIQINAVEPGFTATDLNMRTGTQTVEQGAEIIVRMAQVRPDGPTRRVLRRLGRHPLVKARGAAIRDPGLARYVQPLVERCLAKGPGQRRTAADLLAEVVDDQVADKPGHANIDEPRIRDLDLAQAAVPEVRAGEVRFGESGTGKCVGAVVVSCTAPLSLIGSSPTAAAGTHDARAWLFPGLPGAGGGPVAVQHLGLVL